MVSLRGRYEYKTEASTAGVRIKTFVVPVFYSLQQDLDISFFYRSGGWVKIRLKTGENGNAMFP